MTALTWDGTGKRLFQTGVDKGVLYIPTNGVYDQGYAWNGLTTITESPEGAEATQLYADNIVYLNLLSIEKFKGKIEAYTYPDEFAQCDGSAELATGVWVGQQPRHTFGLSYRTKLGNDVDGQEHGYLLHLVYGLLASPSEKAHATVNDSPEAITFSWDVTSTPVDVAGKKPTATITIDSTKVDPAQLATLENFLYGTVGSDPSLPLPAAVAAIFTSTLTVVTPTAPTYNSSTDVVTIPSITGVIYYTDEDGDLANGSTQTITANKLYKARPDTGYVFPAVVDDEFMITFA